MAWQQPKTNWDTHPKAIEPADMNRIEGNIEAVREQSDMALRLETVSSFPAHTAGRVIYHTGNKRAYVSDGSQWIPIGVEGDAVAANVLAGKKFSSLAAGVGVTGTMPNRGAVTITPGTANQTILQGYHNGSGYVKGDANLVSANILRGKSIFGVVGGARRIAHGSFRRPGESRPFPTGEFDFILGWRPCIAVMEYRGFEDAHEYSIAWTEYAFRETGRGAIEIVSFLSNGIRYKLTSSSHPNATIYYFAAEEP